MAELFNVYFRAELTPGADPAAVRSRLAALFKADEATLDRLFSGRQQLIRRNCSAQDAERYRSAMQRAGAIALVQPAVGASQASAPAANPSPTQSAPSSDGLSLAEPGALLGPPPAPAPPAPDTSHLSLAEAGEPIPGLDRPAPPPPPDTSSLALAPAGADVLEAQYRQRDRDSSAGTPPA